MTVEKIKVALEVLFDLLAQKTAEYDLLKHEYDMLKYEHEKLKLENAQA